MATRYTKDIYWIVGNSKNIPIDDHSLDVITALFTVVNAQEIERCLKKNGYIIHVTANPYHLVEFKELIYDEIKSNLISIYVYLFQLLKVMIINRPFIYRQKKIHSIFYK